MNTRVETQREYFCNTILQIGVWTVQSSLKLRYVTKWTVSYCNLILWSLQNTGRVPLIIDW